MRESKNHDFLTGMMQLPQSRGSVAAGPMRVERGVYAASVAARNSVRSLPSVFSRNRAMKRRERRAPPPPQLHPHDSGAPSPINPRLQFLFKL